MKGLFSKKLTRRIVAGIMAFSLIGGSTADISFAKETAGNLPNEITAEKSLKDGEYTEKFDGLTYTYSLDGTDATLTDVNGSGTTADLTELNKRLEKKGYSLVAIDPDMTAFHYSDERTSAVTTLKIPNTITSIPEGTFQGHPALAYVYFEETGTKNQSKMKSFGTSAFEGCNSLTEVTIPSSLESFGTRVFRGCRSLEKVNFNAVKDDGTIGPLTMEDPSGTTKIKNFGSEGTFYEDDSLTEIILPSTISSIKDYAFGDSNNLNEILVLNKSLNLTDEGTCLFKYRSEAESKKGDIKFYTIYEKNETNNRVKSYAENHSNYGAVHEYLCKGLNVYVEPDVKFYYPIGGDSGYSLDKIKVKPLYCSLTDPKGVEATESISLDSYMVTKDFDENVIGKQTFEMHYGNKDGSCDIINYYRFNSDTIKSDLSQQKAVYYTGKEITFDNLSVSRKADNEALKKDTDYTLSYENNVNAGTASVKIAPAVVTGSVYDGTEFALGTFEINKKPLSDEDVIVSASAVSASAVSAGAVNLVEFQKLNDEQKKKLIRDMISLQLENGVVIPADEYEVSEFDFSKSGKDAGEATISAKDKGKNFTGERKIYFDVEGIDINEASFTDPAPDIQDLIEVQPLQSTDL